MILILQILLILITASLGSPFVSNKPIPLPAAQPSESGLPWDRDPSSRPSVPHPFPIPLHPQQSLTNNPNIDPNPVPIL